MVRYLAHFQEVLHHLYMSHLLHVPHLPHVRFVPQVQEVPKVVHLGGEGGKAIAGRGQVFLADVPTFFENRKRWARRPTCPPFANMATCPPFKRWARRPTCPPFCFGEKVGTSFFFLQKVGTSFFFIKGGHVVLTFALFISVESLSGIFPVSVGGWWETGGSRGMLL